MLACSGVPLDSPSRTTGRPIGSRGPVYSSERAFVVAGSTAGVICSAKSSASKSSPERGDGHRSLTSVAVLLNGRMTLPRPSRPNTGFLRDCSRFMMRSTPSSRRCAQAGSISKAHAASPMGTAPAGSAREGLG